jgi:hypothetical protein
LSGDNLASYGGSGSYKRQKSKSESQQSEPENQQSEPENQQQQ